MSGSLQTEPHCSRWPAMASAKRMDASLLGRPMSEWRALTRRELGLPDDRIVIATGHQAAIWHPGILAKFIAGNAAVEALGRAGAALIHLVVDQDDNNCFRIDVPVRAAGDGLETRTIPILTATDNLMREELQQRLDRPTGEIPAADPAPLPDDFVPATDFIRAGLGAIRSALVRHRNESSVAAQIGRALDDLMSPWARVDSTIDASELLKTTFGRTVVDLMMSEPGRCADAYNRAVDAHPQAGLTRLQAGGGVELPLWRIEEDGRRAPLISQNDGGGPPIRSLRPRALLMTAIMRLAICDLFIHGRGGVIYDKAMEQWIADWLAPSPDVAPMTMATADLRLPLREAKSAGALPTLDEVRQTLRRLLHDPPSRDASSAPSPQKRRRIDAISALPRNSTARRDAFLAYHTWLEEMRGEYGAAIVRARRDVAEHAVLSRRDWPFPLYPAPMLDELATIA